MLSSLQLGPGVIRLIWIAAAPFMVTVLIIWSVTDLVLGSPMGNRFVRPILRGGLGPILVTSPQIYLNAIWRPNILETICSHFLSPSLVQSLLRAPTGLDGKDDLYFRYADCVIIGDCMECRQTHCTAVIQYLENFLHLRSSIFASAIIMFHKIVSFEPLFEKFFNKWHERVNHIHPKLWPIFS